MLNAEILTTSTDKITRDMIQDGYHDGWRSEAHRTLKRQFYAHLYGNYCATRVIYDFQRMYLMGGEL